MSISSLFSGSPSSSNASTPASSPTGQLTPATSQEPVVKASVNPKLVSEKNPQGIKPCCACPETKKLRDDCFLKYGSNIDEDSESKEKCKSIVEKHRECMRGFGFNV
ncbi:hypothetical protein P389DRAFT_188291 [Cystobasidium minutum MCA 4210]|uniref:uncharacterized protein n=1 Tax=Cystobasidium minutum MCA 4210 TaxID=1397322 RepID=UPI0034CF8411|eukprot:jgi/Rhomi1/188291/estExt_fgenesh1_pg.C_2_t20121